MLGEVLSMFGGGGSVAEQVAPLLSQLGQHMEDKRKQYNLDRYFYMISVENRDNEDKPVLKYMVEKNGHKMIVSDAKGNDCKYYGTQIFEQMAGGGMMAKMLLAPMSGQINQALKGITADLLQLKADTGTEHSFYIEHEFRNGKHEPHMVLKFMNNGIEEELGNRLDSVGIVQMILGVK